MFHKTDKDVKKLDSSYIAGGNVKLYTSWKTVAQLLRKLNINLPYD